MQVSSLHYHGGHLWKPPSFVSIPDPQEVISLRIDNEMKYDLRPMHVSERAGDTLKLKTPKWLAEHITHGYGGKSGPVSKYALILFKTRNL